MCETRVPFPLNTDTVTRRAALGSIGSVAVALALGGCETQAELPNYAAITFAHRKSIRVRVGNVVARTTFVKPLKAPNVEHDFPVDLGETAERWARDRLAAEGGDGTITYTVLDASVIETPLEKTDGITGLVTADQSERYEGTIKVLVEAADATTGQTAETEVSVKRSVTIPEDATFNEREKVWYQLTEKLMADLDRQLEAAIRKHMSDFVS